jgi:hypothetical protein
LVTLPAEENQKNWTDLSALQAFRPAVADGR